MLPDGQLFAVYQDSNTKDILGGIHAAGSSTESAYNASGKDYQVNSGVAPVDATIAATYHQGLSLNGTVSEGGGVIMTYALAYQSLTAVSLSQLTGTWSGNFLSVGGSGGANVTFSADGSFTAIDSSNCNTSGSASLNSITGLYTVTMTYESSASDCGAAYAGKTVSGLGYLDAGGLYVVMVSDDGTIGVMFNGAQT